MNFLHYLVPVWPTYEITYSKCLNLRYINNLFYEYLTNIVIIINNIINANNIYNKFFFLNCFWDNYKKKVNSQQIIGIIVHLLFFIVNTSWMLMSLTD